ncbi:MAG: hypothetical protein LBU70_05245 [Chitinispirillales bacterium]|jgi:hypothetical protein|nr:hypothetical protein [Chitinispirillales bacterium]
MGKSSKGTGIKSFTLDDVHQVAWGARKKVVVAPENMSCLSTVLGPLSAARKYSGELSRRKPGGTVTVKE